MYDILFLMGLEVFVGGFWTIWCILSCLFCEKPMGNSSLQQHKVTLIHYNSRLDKRG